MMSEAVKRKKPKVIGLKQFFQKKYASLTNMPEHLRRSFGELVMNFSMIIWGQSGNGKSNFLYQLIAFLVSYGNVLYISLEEGTEKSAQLTALRHLNEETHSGKILFADHEMNFEEAKLYLRRKKSPQFIVIDSLQYWGITYSQYQELKELFPKKSFIFVSHAKGKNPDGATAQKIRYDVGIKVHVNGFVAFPICRYGGNRPYIIWEDGAISVHGRKKVNQYKKAA